MILKLLLNLLKTILFGAFSILPSLPQLSFFTNILTFLNNVIGKGLGLFCFFIRPNTVLMGLGISSALFVFKYSYGFLIWVLKKIPFLDVK